MKSMYFEVADIVKASKQFKEKKKSKSKVTNRVSNS